MKKVMLLYLLVQSGLCLQASVPTNISGKKPSVLNTEMFNGTRVCDVRELSSNFNDPNAIQSVAVQAQANPGAVPLYNLAELEQALHVNEKAVKQEILSAKDVQNAAKTVPSVDDLLKESWQMYRLLPAELQSYSPAQAQALFAHALYSCRFALAHQLLQSGKVSLQYEDPKNNYRTPLFILVKPHSRRFVNKVFGTFDAEKENEINYSGNLNDSMYAKKCKELSTETIKLFKAMVQKGGNPHARDMKGWSVLMSAVSSEDFDPEFVKLFLEEVKSDASLVVHYYSALSLLLWSFSRHLAEQRQQKEGIVFEIIKLLVQQGASPYNKDDVLFDVMWKRESSDSIFKKYFDYLFTQGSKTPGRRNDQAFDAWRKAIENVERERQAAAFMEKVIAPQIMPQIDEDFEKYFNMVNFEYSRLKNGNIEVNGRYISVDLMNYTPAQPLDEKYITEANKDALLYFGLRQNKLGVVVAAIKKGAKILPVREYVQMVINQTQLGKLYLKPISTKTKDDSDEGRRKRNYKIVTFFMHPFFSIEAKDEDIEEHVQNYGWAQVEEYKKLVVILIDQNGPDNIWRLLIDANNALKEKETATKTE